MSVNEELSKLDAVGSAALVKSGEVTPRELVEAAIRRIGDRNPEVNAVIRDRFERALDEAAESRGGRFRGVPIVAKDYRFEVAGEATGYGMAALKDGALRWPDSTFVAKQLQEAGFIVVGRTNTPELATSITTEPLAYGPTRNPWDLERSCGGSSGGSAAAVASLMAPVGLATDGGGSIRIPASACGLVGLKPSRGRISLGPGAAEYWAGASVDGAITRSVRDAAAMLDCLRGTYSGDPYVAPAPEGPFEAEVGREPGRVKVGVFRAGTDTELVIDGLAQDAMSKAEGILEGLGHRLVVATPPEYFSGELGQDFGIVMASDIAMLMQRIEAALGRSIVDSELEPRNAELRQRGKALSATQYLEARGRMSAWARRAAPFWGRAGEGGSEFDLFMTPMLNGLPPIIGETPRDPDNGDMKLVARLSPFAMQANVLGFPAICLPLHADESGRPVGVQLVAGYGRESLLLRIAAQLESLFTTKCGAQAM